ncbi:MAG: MFS family permease [Psychromonas sp.]|jgi:MFS family permease|uniref:MFS transporter n=1 Tax=Psychromonas sp. TaxID=1884585 RepID=UPI0039E2BAB4
MRSLVRSFYLFVAIHSFLIGLLPIFIPVILWNKGLSLNEIAHFIALSAIGFIIALYFWDRLRAAGDWSKIVALSFVLEILLVIILLWDFSPILLSFGALINGAAGCFYWSTQRVLFQRITQTKNSGARFANFQILVMIALKLGILLGSYLLAAAQINLLLIIFMSISTLGYWLLRYRLASQIELLSTSQPSAFSLLEVINFKDTFKSKMIFLIDGLFLFLESYFWVLSLYLLTQQNLLKLGLLIVLLSVLLAFIFYVIKKRIDRTNAQRIFTIAVFGYAISWLLRGQLSLQEGPLLLYSGVLLIAFLSSFFRLAFNKRFYDIASLAQPIQYIICKSYYSQFALLLFFSLAGYFFNSSDAPLQQLQHLYLLIIPLVFVYLFYGRTQTRGAGKLI